MNFHQRFRDECGYFGYSNIWEILFIFLVKKNGPELTSVASLPFCLRKIVAELTSVPVFL